MLRFYILIIFSQAHADAAKLQLSANIFKVRVAVEQIFKNPKQSEHLLTFIVY